MKQTGVAELFNVTNFTVGNWESQIPSLIKFLGYDPVNLNPNSIAELLFAKRRELGWSQRVAEKKLE